MQSRGNSLLFEESVMSVHFI